MTPSNPDLTSAGYGNPLTGTGFLFQEAAPEFRCYEAGSLKHPDWNYLGVFSPFWRLYWNQASGAEIRHRPQCWSLDPDVILIVPPWYRFDCVATKPVSHLWIHFALDEATHTPPTQPQRIPLTPILRSVIQSLQRNIEHQTPASHSQALALLHLVHVEHPIATPRPRFPQLDRVLRAISDRPEANHSNTSLAQIAGYSEESFIRWFRKSMGISPARYLRKHRLEIAGRWLAFTEFSIEEIAEKCGFPNRFHFSRLFSQHYHQGPAAFRQQHRQQHQDLRLAHEPRKKRQDHA